MGCNTQGVHLFEVVKSKFFLFAIKFVTTQRWKFLGILRRSWSSQFPLLVNSLWQWHKTELHVVMPGWSNIKKDFFLYSDFDWRSSLFKFWRIIWFPVKQPWIKKNEWHQNGTLINEADKSRISKLRTKFDWNVWWNSTFTEMMMKVHHFWHVNEQNLTEFWSCFELKFCSYPGFSQLREIKQWKDSIT